MGQTEILKVLSKDGRAVREFIELPFRLHRDRPQWVPDFHDGLRRFLRRQHPFFTHSTAESFLARRGERAVGRITVFENRRHNEYHGRRNARFYHFESEPEPETAARLFDAARTWAAGRGLVELAGPYGFSSFDGGGLLVDGFEHRASMTMMRWHPPYYRGLLEGVGFCKVMDFYSALLEKATFRLPERVRRVVEITRKRGTFRAPRFRSKAEIRRLAGPIGRLYNESFRVHPDFTPLGENEIAQLAERLLRVTDPSMIKILYHGDEVAGFLFAFPDLSAALQRARGRATPLTLLDLTAEKRRTRFLLVNGMGLLPRYQNLGGNAMLYHEIVRAVQDSRFEGVEMVQIAETTDRMLSDMETLGGRVYKTHRIYRVGL